VLKNRASRRYPALCGFYKCSHIDRFAALSKTPHALADGLMLVFQHPTKVLRPPVSRSFSAAIALCWIISAEGVFLKFSGDEPIYFSDRTHLNTRPGSLGSAAIFSVKDETVNDNKVRHIMAQVRSFPGMPATAARLMPLLQNPDASEAQIENVLKYDPGLTANILKLTNSAYFGLPSRVSSVRQAIMLLGWKRLLQLVMTMCMSALMKKPLPGYGLARGELWRHSVAVSVAADVLVTSLPLTDADEVFTAALLHDIGKLVLSEYVQEDMGNIEQMVGKGISFEVAEFVVLGTNHAQVGARILQNWFLPKELVNAVSWHHDPDQCDHYCHLSDVVHVANILGWMIGYGKGHKGQLVEPAFEVIERLGIRDGQMEKLAEKTLQEVTRLSEILT
jgi:putative nucleotidyltransferase with HDIG domain